MAGHKQPLGEELADEQLDAFLKDIGVHSSHVSPVVEAFEKEPSLEQLLDEIYELTYTSSPPPATPDLPTIPLALPLEEEKKKRSYRLIWVTVFLLFGLLAGSAFGFFWGKNQGIMDKPLLEPQEEITTQISHWIKELNTLYQTLEPPVDEMIEPIEPLSEMKQLAPSEMI